MPKGMNQKTGDAPIKKSGHTASTKHGSDPNVRSGQRPEPRDLKVGRSK